MTNVLVTGTSSRFGRDVLTRLAECDSVESVVRLTRRRRGAVNVGKVRTVRGDLSDPDVAATVAAADVVVHLAFVVDQSTGRLARSANAHLVETLLEHLRADATLVLVSSAAVYGAWPDNPVPLTEAAAVRPNPGFGYGEDRARVERRAMTWRSENDDAGLTVLRPPAVVADGWRSWLADRLLAETAVESVDYDPFWQFLHLDDLASAVVHAVEQRLDGVYNVAPDDWLTGAQRRELMPGRARVRVSDTVVDNVRSARSLISDPTAGIAPYLTHSWVLANHRLRATGWEPRWPSDEALVVAEEAPKWAGLNARQRQTLSLTALGVVAGGVAAGAGWLVRRAARDYGRS